MDIQVNTERVLKLRRQKAWSQQHLADVAGLSIKTIQRIEKSQKGSYESVKAIASAFSVLPQQLQIEASPSELQSHSGPNSTEGLLKHLTHLKYAAFGLSLGLLLMFLWGQAEKPLYNPHSITAKENKLNETDSFEVFAQRMTQMQGGKIVYEGNVALSINKQEEVQIQSKEMLRMPNKNVFRGEVAILLDGFSVSADMIETVTQDDRTLIMSDALVFTSI